LQEQLQTYAETVWVIPNCAEATDVDVSAKHTEGGPVTILVASTDTVRVDMVIPALRRVAQAHGEQVRMVAIGPIAHELRRNGVPAKAHPILSYAEFRGYLDGLKDAIGVIPLDDSLFSSCKSAIKYVDYTFAGIPAICSAVSPYRDVVQDGWSGLLVPNGESDWFNAIDRLVRDPRERRRLVTNALAYCRANCSLDIAAQQWNELLSRLDLPDRELQGALGNRESAELRASFSIFPGWRKVYKALRTFYKPSTWRNAFRWLAAARRR
jgi:glycosyltransferase involved in cell wall biosynthesis